MVDISQKYIDKRIYIHHPITRMVTKFVQVKENNSILLMVCRAAGQHGKPVWPAHHKLPRLARR